MEASKRLAETLLVLVVFDQTTWPNAGCQFLPGGTRESAGHCPNS